MAKRIDILTYEESINDLKSNDASDNHSKENNFLDDECEIFEGKESPSDEKFDKSENDEATSILHQEKLDTDPDWTLNDIEMQITEEIEQTTIETVGNRLQYLDDKCMEYSENLNEFFQQAFHELREASILKNWNRVGELQDIISHSEPYYRPLLIIMQQIDSLKNNVRKHGDCLSKRVATMIIKSCKTLENIVDELMSSVPVI